MRRTTKSTTLGPVRKHSATRKHSAVSGMVKVFSGILVEPAGIFNENFKHKGTKETKLGSERLTRRVAAGRHGDGTLNSGGRVSWLTLNPEASVIRFLEVAGNGGAMHPTIFRRPSLRRHG